MSATFDKNFKGTRKEYVEEFIRRVNADGQCEVIHRQFTRFEQVNYLAVKDLTTGVVGGMVMLVHLDKGTSRLSYDLLDEESMPSFHDANARTLSMLSETTNEQALAWREECRAAQQAAAERRKANRVAAQHVDKPYRPSKKSIKTKFGGCRLFIDHPALFERCLKAGVLK